MGVFQMTRLFTLPHAANTDDWYTPPWIFEALGVKFALDVAAPPGGVPWIPAKWSYSLEDDGLTQPWFGDVWCNPPYSSPFAWCEKWATHKSGIIVLRSDLSSRGQATAFAAAGAVFVPTPRLQFVNGHGDNMGGVSFSTVLLARGRMVGPLALLSDSGVFRRLSP